jgi:hypothetical protein
MISATYGDIKAEIADVCGVSAMVVSDARLILRTNAAVRELMNEGEFPGVVDRYHLTVPDGHIVLPSFLDRLMQINIAGCPQTIASPWWQFVAYGPGTREDQLTPEFGRNWIDERMISDRGEYPVQVALPETGGPWRFRIYTAVDENIVTNGSSGPPTCTIQGIDQNGEIARTQISISQWFTGERVAMNWAVPYVQTLQEYSAITAFTKPATNGPIKITAWDGTTETTLATYLFSDTTPSYHHYFSQWLNDLMAAKTDPQRVIRARCRKRFVPVTEDTDVMIISNANAIGEMVIAQWKRKSDNLQSYMAHKQTAIDIMKKEALAYRGKARLPGISFQRGFSIGSDLPALR